jgi:DNA primase
VILCESAIDAISCWLLHPSSLCLSTSGARSNPRWLPALLSQGLSVYCGFDSDATGDAIAEQMIRLHPSLRRIRPSQHDWNDILKTRHG